MSEDELAGEGALRTVVRGQMMGADSAAIDVVTAVAGLLARVAYADRRYEDAEQQRVREELSMVLGFSEEDIDVVCTALGSQIEVLGAGPTTHFAQVLLDRFDKHMRADTVRVLVELAMADGNVVDTELTVIRRVADELELRPELVDALVARARELAREDG